ncbi:leupaxin-like isoform X1 [Montipora capricornis]|uniref:leupaxin-like isoform X1 n=1 Tax=Montipora capricornis TaxID=246305 RepID=UPI0035F1FB68
MPGKTRNPSIEEKLKRNIEFLDALLADLQATSPNISTSPSELRGRPIVNGRESPDDMPPPLPPPPAFEALDPHVTNSKDDALFPPPVPSSSLGQNLSELDSLLENLSSPLHYPSDSPGRQFNSDSPRGSVTSPSTKSASNGRLSSFKGPVSPAAHDVRPEARYSGGERNGPDSPKAHVTSPSLLRSHVQQAREVDSRQSRTASTATKELDDLMASLSDFKVNVTAAPTTAQARLSGDYAKPNKPKSPSASVGKVSQLDSMLGSLQSDMTRQGVSTTKKGECAACNKPIIGQVCTALGRTWHPEHFTCVACEVPLGATNFFERDGRPFCERDYHEQFAPRCAYCNGPILDSCVTALDQTWHPEHFVCNSCGRPFGETGFHERDGKPYCREDYYAMFAPRCGGCGQPIMDSYISALSAHWHSECFVCSECHQAFPGGSFFEHEGRPYCEMHYHSRRGTLCYSCQKPITGRCITAMHRKFHPEHFVCAFCLKQLNKGTFKEQNDKPYCHPCFIKLFG